MYMVAGERTHLYVTHSKDVADQAASDMDGRYEEYEGDELHLDFGGILVGGMQYITVRPQGHTYRFLAHHLSNLMLALGSAIKDATQNNRNYVSFLGYPMGHLMSLEVAQALKEDLRQNWDTYRLQETANVQMWESAIGRMAGSERVNVDRELQSINPAQVN
jgi:hypothetical protein